MNEINEIIDDENEEVCTCKENNCNNYACKGKCGCIKCYNDYQDFLSNKNG